MTSPSSRRAWIEIGSQAGRLPDWCVALLAEGVDRNLTFGHGITPFRMVALLAEGVDRNTMKEVSTISKRVALLAEGVDRNKPPSISSRASSSRPPRGGRG